MSYVTMNEMLTNARKHGYAVGAFNIFNYQSIRAALAAAEACRAPIILQTSVKTVRFYGAEELARLLIPMAERAQVPVALHLDHCQDIAFAKACMDAGWSAIMYDGSALPFEENLANTKEIVALRGSRAISIEGELGAISGVEEDIVVSDADGSLADVALSRRYCEESGIDCFAPAIGTAHGLYHGEPKLSFDRFVEIDEAVQQPLVVHGGTGLSDAVFGKLIALGAAKINVSTALKITYCQALASCSDLSEPLAADRRVQENLTEVICRLIRVFGAEGKA